MSTVNYSVPEDVKQAFNKAYEGQNKSAVVTQLLREAVERAHEHKRRKAAVRRILARLPSAPIVTQEELDAARHEGRP